MLRSVSLVEEITFEAIKQTYEHHVKVIGLEEDNLLCVNTTVTRHWIIQKYLEENKSTHFVNIIRILNRNVNGRF